MKNITEKLTAKYLEHLSQDGEPNTDVWDTELAGYHARVGGRGISFRVKYRNLVRKQRVITLGQLGELTAAQARTRAREVLALVSQGIDPREEIEKTREAEIKKQGHTLGRYLDDVYILHLNRLKDGPATYRRIKAHFDTLLDRPISSLNRLDIERWQGLMEVEDKKTDPPRQALAFGTIKRSYATLQALLNHAVKRKIIESNPLVDVRLLKPVLTTDEEEIDNGRRYLTDEETKSFFHGLNVYQKMKRDQRRSSRAHGKRYLPDLDLVPYVDHVVPWFLTMYYMGFRPGDLMGLQWPHLNFNFKYIRKTIEKTEHHNSEPQTFPLSDPIFDVLKAWWEQCGKPQKGYVFASKKAGGRLSKTAMRSSWESVRKYGGLPDSLVLYTLRHNFASQMVMAGVDLLTVSKLMAHSSIETTIKYYAHLQPDHKRNAVQLFAARVKSKSAEMIHDEIERIAT